jgi:phosphosulfolactate phosphohydrolase-like enzyme
MDHRDRLILALSALVRAEREVKSAWEDAIAAGAVPPSLVEAVSSDPSRLIEQDDIELAEAFVSPANHQARSARAA